MMIASLVRPCAIPRVCVVLAFAGALGRPPFLVSISGRIDYRLACGTSPLVCVQTEYRHGSTNRRNTQKTGKKTQPVEKLISHTSKWRRTMPVTTRSSSRAAVAQSMATASSSHTAKPAAEKSTAARAAKRKPARRRSKHAGTAPKTQKQQQQREKKKKRTSGTCGSHGGSGKCASASASSTTTTKKAEKLKQKHKHKKHKKHSDNITSSPSSSLPNNKARPRFAEKLWRSQYLSDGNRALLFRAVAPFVGAECSVLYGGSYIDVNPSFVFPSVTYVDMDKRAKRFFDDEAYVRSLITPPREGAAGGVSEAPSFRFVHADYRQPLDQYLGGAKFDLLVSLYGGLVSAHCTEHLKVGGFLLANPSHGDVAWASIDERYELSAAVWPSKSAARYRVDTADLDTFLIPKKPTDVTEVSVRASGRGVKYTRCPFVYLFRRVK